MTRPSLRAYRWLGVVVFAVAAACSPTPDPGNSDGDFEMLEWTTTGRGPRLGVIVHHTDAVREWAYDRDSRVGTLRRALDEAPARGWIVVDMKSDWNVVHAFERQHP